MSDDLKNYYTKEINNYMARFDDLNDVDTKIIEEGLKEILGINITTDFQYGAEHLLNEKTGKDERKVELKNIHVYYTYDGMRLDPKTNTMINSPMVGKITYLVN